MNKDKIKKIMVLTLKKITSMCEWLVFSIMSKLSNLFNGIRCKKNNGKYIYANAKQAQVFGCKSGEEIVGKTDIFFLGNYPKLLSLIRQNDQKAKQGWILVFERAPNGQLFLCLKAPYYESNRQIGIEVIGIPLDFIFKIAKIFTIKIIMSALLLFLKKKFGIIYKKRAIQC